MRQVKLVYECADLALLCTLNDLWFLSLHFTYLLESS